MRNGEGPTAVVAALPEEVRPLLVRLSDREPGSGPRGRPTGDRPWIVRGRLSGRAVALVVTGDGERNAREGIRRALEAVRPSRVLVIGVAGGLAPDLAPGSLVVGERVVAEGGTTMAAEAGLVRRAADAGARRGVVATVGRIVDTPTAKASLRATGRDDAGDSAATPAPDVVDLETAFYATEARRAGLPWVVVRSVSDDASERIPPYLEGCRDDGGAVRRGAVLLQALLRPWTVPTLLRLRWRVREAALRLAGAVETTLASISPADAGASGPSGGGDAADALFERFQ